MPKAVILFSFKKDDPSPLLENLTLLKFNRKDGRRTIFSKEFDVDEYKFSLAQLKMIKQKIILRATHRFSSPNYIWRETFKEVGIPQENAILLAGLAMADGGTKSSAATDDTAMSDASEPVPPAAQPIVAELRQESQSQGIVDDDFDVDELVSGLASTKLGGRRRKTRSTRTFTVRRAKKSRSKSRRN
jgi:hypothetical protein